MIRQNITPIGIVAIVLVVAIPLAYSASEPSIIINMISGQAEKPLQVKDSGGAEVFSVDVDGTVFPSSSGGISGVFGTEIVLVDNSGNTGGSNDSGGNEGIMSEVTLPTVAPQYRITAVEVLTDFVGVSSNRICVALADLHGLSYPLPNDEEISIGILSGWNANNYLVNDGGALILSSTVYKIPIVPVILDGGDTFIVLVNECDNGIDIEFVTASSGSIAFDFDMDQTFMTDGGIGQHDESDYSTLRTGLVFDGYPAVDGFEMYLKVYGQPLE